VSVASSRRQGSISLPNQLAVVLSPTAFSQLFGYAYATELEVSLLGLVDRDRCVFRVREFFLTEQQGASSRTETDPEALARLVERLITEGRKDDARRIRCWAHSHPGMDTFWSTTDEGTCRLLCSNWLASLVVSDGFRIRCRLDVSSPVPFTLDHVPVYAESLVDPAIERECAGEVREKIKAMPLFGRRRNRKNSNKEDKPCLAKTTIATSS
jgi:hypothetical protein